MGNNIWDYKRTGNLLIFSLFLSLQKNGGRRKVKKGGFKMFLVVQKIFTKTKWGCKIIKRDGASHITYICMYSIILVYKCTTKWLFFPLFPPKKCRKEQGRSKIDF